MQGSENVLTCPICMDYIVSCKTAICGHSFCEVCIHEAMIRKKECPNCRKDIRKYVLKETNMIDTAVSMMIKGKQTTDESEYERHHDRLKNFKDWKDKHTVKEVKPGDMLDVLDTEYIWCKATVEHKIISADR